MALKKYREKRVFSRTTEPSGTRKKTAVQSIFVVHKHASHRLHYDLRLEMDGVLKSWAVPKGPSLTPLEKRLAVNVEDHPLEYAGFEGNIPVGEYGAGSMIIWDRGKWESLEDDPRRAFEKGIIKFILNGKKLKGKWTLVRLKKDPKNWLFFKDNDEFVSDEDILREQKSVVSGRTVNDMGDEFLEKNKPAIRRSKKTLPDPSKLPYAVKAGMPLTMKPQLASPYEKPPRGESWIYEIKYDGYRIMSFIDHGKVKLVTRNGYDWTGKFKTLAEYCRKLPIESGILDGELIVPDEKGISNFQLLQNAIRDGAENRLQYFIFDIPYYNGYSLRETPLGERKKLLEQILGNSSGPVMYTEHLAGHGDEVFKSACRLSLEGVIAKDVTSPYEERRSKSWIKVKCLKRQEFVIGGFTEPQGGRSKFGALLLGFYQNGKLIYCGRVGTGFDGRTLDSLYKMLNPLEITASPFFNLKSSEGASWVKPELIAEVAFLNWTEETLLRHASFLGLREDKKPEEVVLEQPEPAGPGEHKPRMIYTPVIAGVSITHPDRVIFKDRNITKFDLAGYYEKIADWMLLHIADRPLVLVRCPDNISQCFFQKHPMEGLPDTIKTYQLNKKNSAKYYIIIDDARSLLTLVQFGVVEFHIMDMAAGRIEKPDRMVFDLDPGPDIKPEVVTAAALNFREMLLRYGLESFVKTTGGKGLHLVVPIEKSLDWDEVKELSRILSGKFVDIWPEYLTAVMSKAVRKGKIFIDFFRNTPGASWAAPYTVRTKPDASISMPVHWKELTADLLFGQFTLQNIDDRLKSIKKDPWYDLTRFHQKIPAALIKELRK